ncbi:hypothetical protein [[Limnothrix rosea] IAM M-220]|uniref:hypothetical protein n=1 Tax=[Limnothrix rosea] IAM M-220 TaxID=454133 RepID=UPI00095B815B|nr:hypothetical protein [[Limnothrix rosea] IAM M-220]OKH16020.1 hypothetical protein NIES208_12175 [[Limnothrix rosea] IAM M-220]
MTLKEKLHQIIDSADENSLQVLWQFWQQNQHQSLELTAVPLDSVDLSPFEETNGLLIIKEAYDVNLDKTDWVEISREERLQQIMEL